MAWTSLRNNPVIAALLGTAVTGLGHLYLRRWVRGLGWVGAMLVVSVLFVPQSAVSATVAGTLDDPLAVLPIILLSAVSALDAYLIAKVTRMQTKQGRTIQAGGTADDGESPACPACGKPVDPDLGFCHWCTTEFEVVDVTELDDFAENNPN